VAYHWIQGMEEGRSRVAKTPATYLLLPGGGRRLGSVALLLGGSGEAQVRSGAAVGLLLIGGGGEAQARSGAAAGLLLLGGGRRRRGAGG
jgi:hypothetical protein